MAHNIHFNQSTNRHSFFSVQQKAWHGLGQIVDSYPTSREAMSFAGLDFEVVKKPLFIDSGSLRIDAKVSQGETPTIPVPNYFATVRTDNGTPLGVVGDGYHIVQNRDAFSFFDAIVGGDGIFYETAGALGKGERIFITAKLPGYIQVGCDDLIEKYLFLTNSHDGSGSITAAFTPVRIVCMNTLNAAMRDMTNVIRIRHTSNAKDRLQQAHKVMGIVTKFSDQMEPVFNQWAKVRITDKQLKTLIEMVMAPNQQTLGNMKDADAAQFSTQFINTVESVYEYALGSATQNLETTAGTVFGAYNAVTGYFQNVKRYKTSEDKIKSILLGGTAQLRGQKAFNLCEGFARHGADIFSMN